MATEDYRLTRRELLASSAAVLASSLVASAQTASGTPAGTELVTEATTKPATTSRPAEPGPIIDVHQHTTYLGRSNERLIAHQRNMGVTMTILLPGGTPTKLPSTHNGKTNGLYAGAGVTETCQAIVKQLPDEYRYFVNEVPDLPGAKQRIESFLDAGAIGIGEQKFNLPVDSPQMELIYDIARAYKVPVLLHFQYEMFNTGYENLAKVLKKYDDVNFIGHAQTFWANIDANHANQKVLYPKGPVTPGGLTDKYLSDYPNLYGDLSAGSGLNSLLRDPEHARGFIARHQDRLLFGSDCPDPVGHGPSCTGSNLISAITSLSPSKPVARKLLHDNAKRLLRI
ncbi:MAG TPA: amidohydrolase family protein [Tepidisphaeraceae bacterium]|nr:amidohydrolase family protein [Tepidisphaeraceae bacterium]